MATIVGASKPNGPVEVTTGRNRQETGACAGGLFLVNRGFRWASQGRIHYHRTPFSGSGGEPNWTVAGSLLVAGAGDLGKLANNGNWELTCSGAEVPETGGQLSKNDILQVRRQVMAELPRNIRGKMTSIFIHKPKTNTSKWPVRLLAAGEAGWRDHGKTGDCDTR